jgi:RNA polymerase sigma-B factor
MAQAGRRGPARRGGPFDVGAAHTAYAATHEPGLEAELLQWHSPLAMQLATRFIRQGEAPDDLRQVALLALLRALRNYDPGRGVEFSTYAVPSIVGALKRHFRDRGWLVRPPRRVQETYLLVRGTVENLQAELGRPPTVTEIAEQARLAVGDVVESLEAGGGRRAVPYEVPPWGEGDPAFEGRLSKDNHQELAVEDRLMAERLVRRLPDGEREIVELSFWCGLTQHEIASRLGVSQSTVSRVRNRALSRLAAVMTANAAAA